jgi:hypothetical protein
MTGQPDPENIYIARRTARFRPLVDEDHMDELDAEHLLTAWEREAEARGLDRYSSTFWPSGEEWIAARVRRR